TALLPTLALHRVEKGAAIGFRQANLLRGHKGDDFRQCPLGLLRLRGNLVKDTRKIDLNVPLKSVQHRHEPAKLRGHVKTALLVLKLVNVAADGVKLIPRGYGNRGLLEHRWRSLAR